MCPPTPALGWGTHGGALQVPLPVCVPETSSLPSGPLPWVRCPSRPPPLRQEHRAHPVAELGRISCFSNSWRPRVHKGQAPAPRRVHVRLGVHLALCSCALLDLCVPTVGRR